MRESLNKNPAIVAAVVLAFIAAAGYAVFTTAGGGSKPVPTSRGFFSADDGKTWFVDDINKIPPFKMEDGREAVRAVVVKCEGDEPFVAYLLRYTTDAKQVLDKNPDDPAGEAGKEFKKPGQTQWVPQRDYTKAMQITTPQCPSGSHDAEIVAP